MAFDRTFRITLGCALQRLWRRDIWHLQPGQPLGWRYVLPGQSAGIRLHRHLWWHSRYKLPGLLWLPLEAVRWLHWRLWAGPRRLRAAVARYGPEVETRFGIPVNEQRRRLGYWAKAWCIDPYTAYNWQLYRSGADGLAVIYDSQTSAYHALHNRRTGAAKADHRLLGDKIALAEELSKQGIPMVETAQVSHGDWQDIETALIQHQKLFCKLRSGNQGESAFAVWNGENGMQGLAHDGGNLADADAVRGAWRTLTGKGEVLIQPLLVNHPALAFVAVEDVAVIVRLVTRLGPEGIAVWWAELQVPSDVSPVDGRGFWRFPISVADGAVSTMKREWFIKQGWQDEYDALWQRLSVVEDLAYWKQICDYSLNAHQTLPKVWAIAWDWVITKDGPVLLEGNGGWGLAQAQQQCVDLLSLSLCGTQDAQ